MPGTAATTKNALRIQTLGELSVFRGELRAELPPSKKTRALLAYLVVSGREQRRSRLSALLWDVADDPRGALRWSLSKLRKLVDGPDVKRLIADRDAVTFEPHGAVVDVAELRAISRRLAEASLDELERCAGLVAGELLEGLDLADFDEFQAWCIAEREEARRRHVALLGELVSRLGSDPERALPHARKLVQIDPMDEGARATLLRLLAATGRRPEAEQQYAAAKRVFQELGASNLEGLRRTFHGLEWSAVEVATPPARPPREAAPPPPSVAAPRGLVGRETELARFVTLLDDVVSHRRERVLLLTGEPGVGKSRLLAALREEAELRGANVLAGASFEAERDRPYGPWVDALREIAAARRGDLAPLLGELGDEVPKELTRDRLFGAVVELIAGLAESGLVLVILDDLHWCDEASSSLLHFVARTNKERPVLIALAAREGELGDNDAAMRVVRTLRRERLLENAAVGPLSPDDTRKLVAHIAPDVDPLELARDCGGNPLFALELARAGPGSAGFGVTVHELVRDRFERLGEECCDVLRWGAVLGQHFHVSRLAALTIMDQLTLSRALANLERHALLVPLDGDGLGAYRFAHALVRQVVYGELSAPRRRLMHQRVASVLASSGDADRERATEIAHHAALGGDAALATRACITAGRRCLRLFAPAEAYALARRGMRYVGELDEATRVERTLELMELSYHARPPSEPEKAAAELEALAQRALDLGKHDHARRAFVVLSYLRWEVGDWREAERGMLAAERASRGSDDRERAVALAEAARCLVLLDRDLPHAEAMSLEATAVTARLGVEDPAVVDAAGLLRVHRGELAAAEPLFTRARELARRAADRWAEYQPLEHLVMLHIDRGDYERALGLADELCALAAKFREGSEEPFALALHALCREHTSGDGAEPLRAAIAALRAVDAKSRLAFVQTRAAELDLARGDAEAAGARAEEALTLTSVLRHPSEQAFARVLLLRAARARGAEESAAAHRETLRKLPLSGITSRVRAMVEEELGDAS